MRGSDRASSRQISSVPSTDALSEITSSIASYDCPSTERTACTRCRSPLRTGSPIQTCGVAPDVVSPMRARSAPAGARSVRGTGTAAPRSGHGPALWRLDALEPDLPPERRDRAGAVRVVRPLAHDAVQHDARVPHLEETARALVDAPLDAPEDARLPPAVPGHLLFEPEPTVALVAIQRGHDLVLRADADELSRLQVGPPGGRGGQGPPHEAPAASLPEPEPRRQHPRAHGLRAVEQPDEQGPQHRERADVAGADVDHVLAEVTEREQLGRRPEQLGGLARPQLLAR